MASTTLDISIVSNNDVTVRFTVNKRSDGLPLDLTGYAIKWEMFCLPRVIKTTSDSSIILLDQTTNTGQFQFIISEADTINVLAGTYNHEAVLQSPAGVVTTICNNNAQLTNGTVYVRQQLTVQ